MSSFISIFFQEEGTPEQIDLNPESIIAQIDSWVDSAVRLIPNIVVAIIIVAIFYGLAQLMNRVVQKNIAKRDRANLGQMLGSFVWWIVMIGGLLLGATVVVPTLNAGDLIAGLGVSSVAIGFAFKDILQNWLAGLLILLRQPFRVEDQIEINGYEGTVQRIETRATIIKTYDGQEVVIPNSDIYTNAVLVKTAHNLRRSQYDIGVGYGDNIQEACDVIRKAIEDVEGVQTDPAPEALPWDLAASWVTIRARWWTDSYRASVVNVHAKVIQAVKEALDEAKIDMPYDTQVQLFHDQTEAADGNRDKQREGWPSKKNGATKPRWQAQTEYQLSTNGAD